MKRTDPHALLDLPLRSGQPAFAIVKRRLARLLGLAAAELLTPTALEDPDVRAKLWRKSIAAQPKGFYASMVDPLDLRSAGASGYGYPEINLNRGQQLRCLEQIFPRYQAECAGFPVERPEDWRTRPRFYTRNDAFQNIDALAYWAIIRFFKPARIVEVGSGFSTLLAGEAVRLNGCGRVTAIDPFPREFVRRSDLGIELIVEPAELTAPGVMMSLRSGDIVFVDSSHVIRQGGDVNWFFLDILPRLPDGVLVHIHDVHFPFDYPIEFVTNRNVYWTEQYLLHTYLAKNCVDEVLFSSRYSAHSLPEETRAAFPSSEKLDGSSFWMRVHDQSATPLGSRPAEEPA
jgi:hypothetical protein